MKTSEISREIIYGKALKLLGRREYSVWGLTKKLQEKFPLNFAEISDVIKELVEKKWLSDERFCEYLVREKTQHSGWGERKIIMKLNEHKIDTKIIKKNIAKFFPKNIQIEKGKKLAQEKLEKLRSSKKEISNYDLQQKVRNFLISRGFPFEIIDEIL